MGQKAIAGTTSNGQPKVDYYNDSGDLRETRVGGDRAWRNNNPGNICGDRSQIGTDPRPQAPGEHKPPFSIFPDMETGKQAKASRKYRETNLITPHAASQAEAGKLGPGFLSQDAQSLIQTNRNAGARTGPGMVTSASVRLFIRTIAKTSCQVFPDPQKHALDG